VSIFCVMPVMERTRSEKRLVSWKRNHRMTTFQRPPMTCKVISAGQEVGIRFIQPYRLGEVIVTKRCVVPKSTLMVSEDYTCRNTKDSEDAEHREHNDKAIMTYLGRCH
jgi:hypothetical protein